MGNGLIYSVPRFQRDYSWTDVEWEDLWADMQNLLDGTEPVHYMGYLVLQSSDSKNYNIIDGQQRITTLSIFILAILKNFARLIIENVEPTDNKIRLDTLRNSFIGYLDPVSLVPKSKLTLNRNNNAYYQNYIVPLLDLPQRGYKATEHQMRKSFEWFEKKIWEEFGSKKQGSLLANVIDQLSDKLFFTVITVTDELNAYKVFETLNARGVKLSSTDLLKNYLFSVVNKDSDDPIQLDYLDEKWEILVSKLGSESFPDFLRTHWNSKNKFVRATELFKTIRSSIKNRENVFTLLREMEADADIYTALSNPEDVLWRHEPEQRNAIEELRMFNVRQLYSLLLTGHRKMEKNDFTALLKACSVISFRYNVISNLLPSEQEKIYNGVAEQLNKDKLITLNDVLKAMRSIYPNDASFQTAFSDKELKTTQSRNKRIVRYILFRIESHLSGIQYDFNNDKYNIEHILPENPADNWPQFNHREHEDFVYRLGNMTLMTVSQNRDIGNIDFTSKRAVLESSTFQLTQKIGVENSEWTPSRIGNLQRWMAEQAKSIWKISQLA